MEYSSIKNELSQGHSCASTTVGLSMFPMLRNRRDIVILEPVTGALKRYDVAMYQRPSGQYVLHRILRVKPDGYVICGDNQFRKEYPVPHEWVQGVLSGFYRGDRFISVKDWRYRIYVHIWCDFFPVRAFILRIISLYKRVKKMLRRKSGEN